jgi:uncharacterized protein involved in outer membrane biogenesis
MAPASPVKRTHRQRALLWVVAALAVVTSLYALGGFVLLPRLVRGQLIQYGAQQLHSQLRVGAVRFNPFTLHGQISDFELTTAGGAPLARFARLDVSAALSSLWRGVVTLKDVQLDAPALELQVDRDGTLDWAHLAEALPAQGSAPTAAPHPLGVRIEALRLHAGRIHFEDRSHDRPFSTVLDPIELELIDFRSAAQFNNQVHLSARTLAGERLEWNGEFSLQPFASSGALQLSALKAATIAAYLGDQLPFALLGGRLDAQASYRWSSGSAASQTVALQSASLTDVKIAPRGPVAATSPWIELPQLQLSGAQADLATHRLQIHELRLQRPSLQLWREPSGAINLLQLLQPSSANASVVAAVPSSPARSDGTRPLPQRSSMAAHSASAAASASAPWSIGLERLKLEDGTLALEDRAVQPAAKLRLSAIGLQLRGFSSAAPEQPLALELSLHVGDGGALTLQGELTRAAPSAHLKLDLQRLDLTALQPYLAQQTDLALYRGSLSAQAELSYASAARSAVGRDSGSQLDVSGSLSVADLAARERTGNSELLNWQSLELSGVHYRQRPDALQIEHITLRRAYGRVMIGPDGTLNVAQVLHPARSGSGTAAAAAAAAAAQTRPTTVPQSAPAPADTAPARMPIRIARIDIRGSTANFTDQSVRPTFSAAILGLHGSIVGLSSAPEARAQVHLSGQIDRYAPVSIDGELNLLAATAYSDLSLNFSNIDLTIFNPYSGKFAGYSIAQGKLSTQMHYHVENRKLQATHHIVIDQLEFGPATENKPAVPLPIKLAASLLKDRHGVISIDLPVSGSVSDPSFRLGPLIWRAALGLLTKAVTAPFSWLGSLFGGGEKLAYVDFEAGSAQLRAEDRQKVAQLAKALIERPQLKLDIPLHTIGAADDRALALAALAQAVSAQQSQLGAASAAASHPRPRVRGARATPEASKSPQLLALEALYRSQFHAAPDYPPELSAPGAGEAASVAGADGAAPPTQAGVSNSASSGTTASSDPDPRSRWLERQLLVKFLPNGAQRDALGRARADAVHDAIVAAGQVSAERIFLTNRLSGGGSAGMSRMELQLQ